MGPHLSMGTNGRVWQQPIATIVMEMEELADEEPYAWTRAPILPCGPVLSSPVNPIAQKYRGPRVCHHKERFRRVEESAVDQVGR
jgi:hypothetical protein